MPIIGLTDRGASFPRIGELRKGAPKPQSGNKPGKDLKHFRFTSKNDDVVKMFNSFYGDEPNEIRVFLPYHTADENFESWIEEWGAGSLKWRGDGKTLHIWQTPQGTYSQEKKPQPAGGKQVGRLKVIIPELGRLAYVVALTTSIHDIVELSSNLTAYEAMAGSLQGIPFILSRVPRMVSTPTPDGKRARREKWLLHIEAAPEWVQAQLNVMQHAALPGNHDPLMIESGEPDFEVDDDGVIIDSAEDFDDEPQEAAKDESKPAHDMTPPNDETVAMWRDKVAKQHRLKVITVAGMVANAVPYFDNDYHVMNYTDLDKDNTFTDNEVAVDFFDHMVEIGRNKVNGAYNN